MKNNHKLNHNEVLETFREAWSVAWGQNLKSQPFPAAKHAVENDQKPAALPQPETPTLRRSRASNESWKSTTLQGPTKILIIEDDPPILDLLGMIFRDYDCEIIRAMTSKMGLEQAHRHLPNIILMDFNLPGMNGYEIILQMRDREALQKIPVIMVTGSPRVEKLEEVLHWETVAYLKKPIDKQSILNTVQKNLGGLLPRKPSPSPFENDDSYGELTPVFSEPPPQPVEPAAEQAPEEPIILPPIALAKVDPPAHAPTDLNSLMSHGAEAARLIKDYQPQMSDIHLVAGADETPIIKFVDGIITYAVEKKASDIHLEPQETCVRSRIRIDGELVAGIEVPINMAQSIAARIKIMSNLDISERRVPQDGRFKMQFADGNKVEFRVSTLPCKYGEKIVMRILGQSKIQGNFAALGLPPRDEEVLQTALASSTGMILVTGPTGSGKTTSLYTMIAVLNSSNRNILTVEDPIEYELPGISQVGINNEVGLSFEKTLRAFLRQDPDIILVGEIRDFETADIAVKASVTGHLVLSTLHTNSAATTISRLLNMGLPSYMITAALRVVVAQRLVRLLCPHCKMSGPISDHDRRILTPEENLRLKTASRGVGCTHCGETGYSGRAPVMEVLPVRTAMMRELITSGASADVIQALALQEGMRTLRDSVFELIESGKTSLAEAMKILVAH